MRPDILNYLFKSISIMPGIGPKLEILYNKLTGNKIVHLLWHLPYNIIKREMHENIHNANINTIVTIKVKIIEHQVSKFKRQPYKVKCICVNVPVDIVFFLCKTSLHKNNLTY